MYIFTKYTYSTTEGILSSAHYARSISSSHCFFTIMNGKIAKMALLNPCMKFKTFFGQKTSFEALWKCHLQKVFITFSRVRQIQDLGQSKYKLRLFSKMTHGILRNLFIRGSYRSIASLESKFASCPSLSVHNSKKQCAVGCVIRFHHGLCLALHCWDPKPPIWELACQWLHWWWLCCLWLFRGVVVLVGCIGWLHHGLCLELHHWG